MKTTTVRWIEDMTFAAETGSGHTVVMDGKTGAGPSPMELLLVGMAGCTAVDVVSILKKQRQSFQALEVRVQGKRADSHPKVYTHITVEYIVRGDVSEEKLQRAIALSQEKYCSASIMLGKTAQIETRYAIHPSD